MEELKQNSAQDNLIVLTNFSLYCAYEVSLLVAVSDHALVADFDVVVHRCLRVLDETVLLVVVRA